METKKPLPAETPRFSTPAEELSHFKERVEAKEESLRERGFPPETERVVEDEARAYARRAPEEVLAEKQVLTEKKAEGIVLDLIPETHDGKMGELLGLLETKGLRNTLSVLQKMDNPHLEDDFHRVLAQYVKSNLADASRATKNAEWRALRMTLFEIALPERGEGKEEQARPLKEILSGMEQFYAGMQRLGEGRRDSLKHYTMELALPGIGEELVFYAAIPDIDKELFSKQVLAIFPKAELHEQKNDYNVFTEAGVSAGAEASFSRNAVFPLKTYEQFDYDPLLVLLNAFSSIKEKGEGAAVQLVVRPVGGLFVKKYQEAAANIRRGASVEEATNIAFSIWQILKKEFGAFFFGKRMYKGAPSSVTGVPEKPKPIDPTVIENIERKAASPVVAANLRIVASAGTKERAEELLLHLESAFNQFENTRGNKFLFKKADGWRLNGLLRAFSFRDYRENALIPLNLAELTSLLHFPQGGVAPARFKQTKAAVAPMPLEAAKEGTLLGVNRYREVESEVFLGKEDRLRHFYVIGQTGTGKTSLLKNMIISDMRSGEGVCMIDPHGSDVLDVLSLVPPERAGDVIYFDPSYTERVMSLNMLEYDPRYPEQKTFVVNELFNIFQKLYGAIPESMGPMFEQYFRNAALLVLEDTASGATLLDIARVLSDKTFREMKLSHAKNPLVSQFWKEIAEKAGGEQALENIVPYITSKFDVFMANDIMRPIIAQEKSALDFRKIMDERKILLVNLAKGRLGDINAHLLGLIIVGKILMAALSRVDAPADARPPFYLYIDEFQNVTTDSITTILSEARKYNLSLTMAHQFIAQLEEDIKNAVFGNVGSIAAFRVGAEDADVLARQFEPTIAAHDLINLDNFNAYVKLLSGGKPIKPFSLTLFPPEKGSISRANALREASYMKYCRPREEVEEAIRLRYTPQTSSL